MFDPVMNRLQMEAHDYQAVNLQSFSSFKDVYLVDFLKLPLKSTNDYNDAFGYCITDINGRISPKRCGTYPS